MGQNPLFAQACCHHYLSRDIACSSISIVEQGTHEQLLAQKGRYYNLYTMQWAAQERAQPTKTFSEN